MASTDQDDDFELVDSVQLAKYIVAEKQPDISKLRAWLKPTDYDAPSSEYRRHLTAQASGTGEWVRETPQFSQWHSSDSHGSIWVKAVAGAGKSVVAASMVDSLSRNESVPVLHFFFRQVIETNRASRSLLQDWLTQLLPFSEVLQASFWELLEGKKEVESLSSNQLWKYLLDGLRGVDRAYCVVDALDEMTIDEEFLSRLNALGASKPKNIKILMTSRPKQYLQQTLRDPQVIHVSLEEELVQRDISVFVGQRTAAFGHDDLDDDTREFVRSTVCQRSQGLFLYARLMLDQIAQSIRDNDHTAESIRQMAAKLPIGLEDMYNRILADHAALPRVNRNTQILILRLVTHSARPLRLIELAEALKSEYGAEMSQNDRKDVVRSSCGPLLEILEDEVVQILHHSFTEFLLDVARLERCKEFGREFPVIESSHSHRIIAVNSLVYLSSLDELREKDTGEAGGASELPGRSLIGSRESFDQKQFQNIFLQHAFLEYAARNWPYHARHLDSADPEFLTAVGKFCQSHRVGFKAWLSYMASGADSAVSRKDATCLHVAAGYGLTQWIKHLIDSGENIDALDGDKHSPLFWAAKKGHCNAVKVLLKAGAKPDIDGYDGLKPLHVAALRNHSEIVRLLLANGVSPTTPKTKDIDRWCGNAPSTVGDHPLMYASQSGNVETVLAMVPYTAAADLEQALCWVAEHRHSRLLSALLEDAKISPNAVSCVRWHSVDNLIGGETALMLAVKSLEPECVRILLEKGADAKAKSSKDMNSFELRMSRRPSMPEACTPLHFLASLHLDQAHESGAKIILDALLSAGADMEARDWRGNTPLLMTLSSRYPRAMPMIPLNMFLSAGANPEATDNNGETLLHRACKVCASTEITTRILDCGVNVGQKCIFDGTTPLHCAAGNIQCPDAHLDLLMKFGADINVQDFRGETALHHACMSGSVVKKGLLDVMLAHGANPNIQNEQGQTCLHMLRSTSLSADLQLSVTRIVDSGADLEICDNDGMTVLLDAVAKGSALVEIILQHSKKPSLLARTTGSGKTVLHLACRRHFPLDLFERLLKSGANPRLTDIEGNTLLHEVAAWFEGAPDKILLVERLVELGVPVNARNHQGRTAAHVTPIDVGGHRPVASPTPESLVQVLLRLAPHTNVNVRDKKGYTPLHLMSATSERLTFSLITSGADLAAKSSNSRTPLHCAARARQSGIILLLLQFAKNTGQEMILNHQDIDGRTALHDACRSGRPESVKLLIDAGADIDIKDKACNTPLMVCAEYSHENMLWQGVRKRTESTGFSNQDESRPVSFHYDTYRGLKLGDAETSSSSRVGVIAKMLIRAGANTNLNHALERAVLAKNSQLVAAIRLETGDTDFTTPRSLTELLLMLPIRHLDLTLESYDGYGPGQDLIDLIPGLDESIFEALVSKGLDCTKAERPNGEPVIVRIARLGLTEYMTKIISQAKLMDDPNHSENLYSGPLLHIACLSKVCNLEMLELLVSEGQVDVNARTQVEEKKNYCNTGTLIPGPTALHVLAEGDYFWQVSAIRYLLNQGANVDALDNNGQTALDIACGRGYYSAVGKNFFTPQCCETLLEAGANPNRVDSTGLTPLNKARSNCNVIRILLRYGADVNAGKKGILMSAIEEGHIKTVQTYLECGADCNIPDKSTGPRFRHGPSSGISNCYPLLVTALRQSGTEVDKPVRVKMMKLLLDHGAKIDLPLSDSETLVHYLFRCAKSFVLRPLVQRPNLDFNIRDQHGRTVFMAACESYVNSNHLDFAPTMEEENRRKAAYVPSCLLLANSIHHGASMDYQAVDNDGRHFVFYLSHRWKPSLSYRFLRIPGNANLVCQKDHKGYSVLHCALQKHSIRTCFDFLKYGADILDPDPDGNTALHLLCGNSRERHRSYGFMTIFLELGGHVDARNNRGQTALHVLLAEADSEDDDGFDHRFKGGTWDLFGLLVSWGANVSAADNDGSTALHFVGARRPHYHRAKEPDDEEDFNTTLFRRVVRLGGDPLKEDKNGRTALDVAAVMGNKGILKLYQRTKK